MKTLIMRRVLNFLINSIPVKPKIMLNKRIKLSHYFTWLLVLNMLVSCTDPPGTATTREAYKLPDSVAKKLVIDSVYYSNLTHSIRLNGMVNFNADKVVNVFPIVSGNVQGISVQQGDYVPAGRTLGTIRSAEVVNYDAALINAETNLNLASRQLEKTKDMYKSGLASQVDVTSAQVAHQQAVAAKEAATRILHINGSNRQGVFNIKSPISGFVIQRNINNGMSIRTDNSTPMFVVSDLSEVWIEANVYEANIGKVHVGDQVDITTLSYPDKVFKGKIDRISQVLDPSSKVEKVRVVLKNTNSLLKPQMFATVIVNNTEPKQALTIPSNALIYDNSQYYVLVYHSRSDIRIRQVSVISANEDKTYISRGVEPGERLVGSDALLIYGALNN